MTRAVLSGSCLLLALSSSALAQSTPQARPLLDESRSTFSTKGHPKANGLNMTFSYPRGWVAKEGVRPHVVQFFVNEKSPTLESAMIIVNDLALEEGSAFSEKEMLELLAPPANRKTLPAGATLVSVQTTKIEGIPAGSLEYKLRGERAGVILNTQYWKLDFISGSSLVTVLFSVISPSGSQLASEMARFKPLFTQMANSIVLPDKWASP